jgi:hypothetical protein
MLVVSQSLVVRWDKDSGDEVYSRLHARRGHKIESRTPGRWDREWPEVRVPGLKGGVSWIGRVKAPREGALAEALAAGREIVG